MSKVKIQGNASGTGVVTLTAPNTNTDRTITLPDGDISLGVGIDDNATSTAITIDSSENVGFGVTPEPHHANWTGIDIGGMGNITGETAPAAGRQFTLNNNAYLNTSENWVYKHSSDEAAQLQMFDGKFRFRTAPTGTADSAISWTTAMTIDNAGIVTKPLQPAAVAYSMPAPSNNGTLVYSTEKFDNAGNMNLTNGRFTCPVAGVYSVSISGFYNIGRSNNGGVAIRVNNSLYVRASYSNESTSNYVAITGVSLVKVAANDYITIFTEGDMHDNDASVFSVHLVG